MKPLDAVGPIDYVTVRPLEVHTRPKGEQGRAVSGGANRPAKRVDPEGEAKRERAREIAERLNHRSRLFDRRIKFEVPSDSQDVIAKIIDQETGKVIRQVPPAELVELAKRIDEIHAAIFRTEA